MLKSFRYALRMLFKTPGFTLVSVCSLAIGIGATSAQFSIGDALLMRPLPVPEPSRVVAVTSASSAAFGANVAVSYPDYRDFRDGNRSFESLLASGFTSYGFSRNQTALPKITFGVFVSGNYFRTLGVQPRRSRYPGPRFLGEPVRRQPHRHRLIRVAERYPVHHRRGDARSIHRCR